MEVVNKIKRTDLSREMVMQGIDELITEIDDSFDFNIATTYDVVVKFIEEYNKVKEMSYKVFEAVMILGIIALGGMFLLSFILL